MIICGFAGYSGSGKSTLAKMLAETIPNSRYIDGDSYMFETFSHFKEVTEKMWGDSIYNSRGERSFNCVTTSGEKGIKFRNLVWPWINEQLQKEIELAENDGIEFLVIDWLGLPAVEIWKNLDMRIYIISDDETRYEKLEKRQYASCNREIAKKREEFYSYKYDITDISSLTLENDYTEECKNKNLKILLDVYNKKRAYII